MTAIALDQIARIPLPGDNVAIATQRLEAGTIIDVEGQSLTLDYTLLEGHRFAIEPIANGEPLLSWQLPFGTAIQDIAPGSYVCNAGMLEALGGRSIDFALPPAPNFTDQNAPHILDEANFQAASALPGHTEMRTFMGYPRPGQRGVGTRNMIILMGTTSHTAGYVRQLESRLQGLAADHANIDGIVAIAHTEGGGTEQPNNLQLLLRTLAGFMVHPNVGAVLAVDYGSEAVTNAMLKQYMEAEGYPLADVQHHFLSLTGGFAENLAAGEAVVRSWLAPVNASPRQAAPLSALKIALQCGGSDAFSGISGNPLASWVAKEVIRYGGAANLAETDELLGAEAYVLQKVRDIATARKFLATIERFKERVSWHGSSAEGNPSGGNKYRGLYNIALKSIGAAMKRHPDVPLDYVIDYSELMAEPGYYFMDSPGNDLESIAGQVAAGCNMIFFVTGNGSITNFPFVPTIKIVTTSKRFELLSKDMDVNAGAYLDGTPMDELGQQTLDLTVDVASGQLSIGEKAGHAQVQLWRNWQQTDASNLELLLHTLQPSGASLKIKAAERVPEITFEATPTQGRYAIDQVGLILPTSLCAGQIARMAANGLNRLEMGHDQGLSRFVALVHTEGCGVSSGTSEELYVRTLLGYVSHPLVKHCLLLEHGCEKTHNDYMRHAVADMGLDPQQFGWASVQLDGGIDLVMQKIEAWFRQQIEAATPVPKHTVGLGALRLGLLAAGSLTQPLAQALSQVTRAIVNAGGTVVVPENDGLLASNSYVADTLGDQPLTPSLAYAQQAQATGFHIMETPSKHWVETLVGLGATGVDLMISVVGNHPMQGHPMVPVLQLAAEADVSGSNRQQQDLDLVLSGDAGQWPDQILQLVQRVIAGEHAPRLTSQGNIDFQITRGLLGVSL